MTTLTAHFDGQVLVPEQPVELPTDCVLEITVRPLSPAPSKVPHQATLDLMREWEREDEALSPEQKVEDERVFAQLERDEIPRVRV